MKVFIVSAMILACAFAAPGVIDNRVESDSSNKMMQYFGSCFDNEDITTCLTVKGIAALNRAARASNIQITKGVVLTRDPTYARSGKALSENEIVTSLPSENEERSSRLFEMATESVSEFLKSHSLQFKLPEETTQEVSRALEEGRGKLKKKLKGPLLMFLGSKIFALVPLFLVGLAFLAFKALIVSKIALVLALVLSVGKMMGGGGGLGGLGGLGVLGKVAGLSSGLVGGGASSAGSGYANSGATAGGYTNTGATGAGWSGSGNSAYPYARSYDEAQDLAYSAHTQNE
ncbi:uncharacterized protein Osi14 [Chironomus tepperi]|uniref:uncharacterized protein Osi14 n=1 Tax=Chironomus tepperi TaxID=113505 RepID=UPI00391F5EFF